MAEQQIAATAWTEFWNAAKPTVDAARVFDTAGAILERLLYLDDLYLALNDLVLAGGMVGDSVRGVVADEGLERVVDALGGASPGSVLRSLFRQVLTDYFIEHMAEDGMDRGCLHDLFCWMSTQAKREAIEAALGPVAEFEFGIPPFVFTFPLRASLVPGYEEEQTGALGHLFAALSEGMSGEALDALDSCDLAWVRDWLAMARNECLVDLKEDLEPDWDLRDLYSDGPRDPSPIEPPPLQGGLRDWINP